MFRRLNMQACIRTSAGIVTLASFLSLAGCAAAPLPGLDVMARSGQCRILNVQTLSSVQVLEGFTFSNGKVRNTCAYFWTTGEKTLLAVTLGLTDVPPFRLRSGTFQVVDGAGTVICGKRGDPLLCRRVGVYAPEQCRWAKASDSLTNYYLVDNWYWRITDSRIECTILFPVPADQLKGSAVVTRGRVLGMPDDYVLLGMLDGHTSP